MVSEVAPGHITLTERSGARRISLIHAISGDVTCYFGLASHPDWDWSIDALAAPAQPYCGYDEAVRLLSQAAAASGHAIDVLGGWSMGGVLAHAVADRLVRQGTQPAGLILFDSYTCAIAGRFDNEPGRTDCDMFVVDVLGQSGSRDSEFDESPEERLSRLCAESSYRGPNADDCIRLYRTFAANVALWRTIELSESPVAILLFQPQETPAEKRRCNAEYWRSVTTGRFAAIPLPGNHFSLIGSGNSKVIADHLRRFFPRNGGERA